MYYPRQHHYTDVPVVRVTTKSEVIRLLEEGWWLDYFWISDCHNASSIFIHCATDTKKVIGDAKSQIGAMLEDGELMDSQDNDGNPTFRLSDDDIMFT